MYRRYGKRVLDLVLILTAFRHFQHSGTKLVRGGGDLLEMIAQPCCQRSGRAGAGQTFSTAHEGYGVFAKMARSDLLLLDVVVVIGVFGRR